VTAHAFQLSRPSTAPDVLVLNGPRVLWWPDLSLQIGDLARPEMMSRCSSGCPRSTGQEWTGGSHASVTAAFGDSESACVISNSSFNRDMRIAHYQTQSVHLYLSAFRLSLQATLRRGQSPISGVDQAWASIYRLLAQRNDHMTHQTCSS
jgi:hypothetical protein